PTLHTTAIPYLSWTIPPLPFPGSPPTTTNKMLPLPWDFTATSPTPSTVSGTGSPPPEPAWTATAPPDRPPGPAKNPNPPTTNPSSPTETPTSSTTSSTRSTNDKLPKTPSTPAWMTGSTRRPVRFATTFSARKAAEDGPPVPPRHGPSRGGSAPARPV